MSTRLEIDQHCRLISLPRGTMPFMLGRQREGTFVVTAVDADWCAARVRADRLPCSPQQRLPAVQHPRCLPR